MTVADPGVTVGRSLRWWRERRGLTQLELSAQSHVSAKHLSFIETGRSVPTAEMILRLAEYLDVPLGDRNAMLLRAGFAPAYSGRQPREPSLSAINDAITRILDAHTPYPAVVVDLQWNIVAANDAICALAAGSAAALLEPPVNVLRLTLHPDGMAPRIVNLPEWRSSIISSLQRDSERSADMRLSELVDELRTYPAPDASDDDSSQPMLVVPIRLRTDDGVISLFSTTTVFGSPTDVTVAELAIETFYPEDAFTASYFQQLAAAG